MDFQSGIISFFFSFFSSSIRMERKCAFSIDANAFDVDELIVSGFANWRQIMRNASFTIRHSICGLLAMKSANAYKKHYSQDTKMQIYLCSERFQSATRRSHVFCRYVNICDAMNNGSRKLFRRSTHTHTAEGSGWHEIHQQKMLLSAYVCFCVTAERKQSMQLE